MPLRKIFLYNIGIKVKPWHIKLKSQTFIVETISVILDDMKIKIIMETISAILEEMNNSINEIIE